MRIDEINTRLAAIQQELETAEKEIVRLETQLKSM
jgi:predicted  nucleic acid-binding Zn-ribbon protein